MKYLAKLKEEFPSPQSAKRYQEMIGLRDKYSRWYSAHRAIASTFYSRVNAALDHGRYAGGLSVLDVILAHAQDPGYKLDYEEYVDVLDDVCAITIQLLGQMMERRPRAASTRAEADELACVVRNAIKYLTAFAPDCEPKSRDLFQQHCRSFADIPWIKHVPGWDELRAVMK